jgi:hypothetical protein
MRYLSRLEALAGNAVVCSDYRKLDALPPDVCDALVGFTRNATPRVERSAILIPASPTLAMQFGRVLKEAPHPSRRVFTDGHEAKAWLSGVLTAIERDRLGHFLDNAEHQSAP